MTKKWL